MNCFNPFVKIQLPKKKHESISTELVSVSTSRGWLASEISLYICIYIMTSVIIYIYMLYLKGPQPHLSNMPRNPTPRWVCLKRVTHVILWLINIFLIEMLNARYHFQVFIKFSRPETPNSVGEWEFNVSNASNISYETKRDEYEARRFRICSSRNGLRQRKQLVCVESSTRSWCEDIKRNGTKSSKEKHSRKMKRRDLRTRTSKEHPKELLHMQREGRAASRS